MTNNDSRNNYYMLAVIAVVMIIGLVVLLQPEDPQTNFSDAVEEVGEGFEDAGRELDPNRTTGEKVGDAIEDMGEDIEDAILWQKDELFYLDSLVVGEKYGLELGRAYGINDHGKIVGMADYEGGFGLAHAYLLTPLVQQK